MSAHLAEDTTVADLAGPKPIDPLVGSISLVSEIAYRFPINGMFWRPIAQAMQGR
jgi:hypothetical protein